MKLMVLTYGNGSQKKKIIKSINSGPDIKQALFFITAGIITGGFWADQCWGVFWHWDPKEIWALITWFFLLSYFYLKSEKIQQVVIILAFLAMLFTYFGITFLLPGLHSYY